MNVKTHVRCYTAVAVVAVLLGACDKMESESTPDVVSTSANVTNDLQEESRNATAPGDDTPRGDATNMLRWSARMRPNEVVRISNDYGDIRVTNSADSGLIFSGTFQKLEAEEREPLFSTDKFARGLELVVTAPEQWTGRVEAGVHVPKGARLEPKSTSGLIQIRVSDNPIIAYSESGQLALRSSGPIRATTHSGNIQATYESDTYEDKAGTLESNSGDIEVWLRPDASLQIVTTAGSLINNIPESVGKASSDGSGTTQIKMGTGNAQLRVVTRTGKVTLNTIPVDIPVTK